MTDVPEGIERLAKQTALDIVNGVTGHTVDTAPDRAEHLLRYAAAEETLVRAMVQAVTDERYILAGALRKFAPDISHQLVDRWNDASNALPDFLAFLRKEASR